MAPGKWPRVRHGRSRTPEYQAWASMCRRCENPSQRSYKNYGGRGIRICAEWRGVGGFVRFLGAVGEKPTPGHTLDRIDNSKGYEPGNVRWATPIEQARNRRCVHWIEANGERLLLVDWAERLGCGASVISCRIRDGWPEWKAVTTPVRHPKNPRGAPKPPLKGRPRGERSGSAKITKEQALEIRAAVFTPDLRRKDLAARMAISESAVKAIRRRVTWAHLDDTSAHAAQVIDLAERQATMLPGKKDAT